jgi:hypothetical protein
MRDGIKKVVSFASAITFLSAVCQHSTVGQTLSRQADPVKVQDLTPLKSINQQVRVPLRTGSVVLHVYLPPDESRKSFALYSSGSGGWHQFDSYVATALAERGMAVCGISVHSYLKRFYSTSRPASADDLAGDYRTLIKEAREVVGVDESTPLILSGWSLGAGYAALAASDPMIKRNVRGVISISLSRDNEAALSVGNRLLSRLTGKTFGPSFNVTEYLSKVFPLPVAIIQAGGDRNASPKSADQLIASAGESAADTCRLFNVEGGRSHSFGGARSDFDHALDQALEWISTRRDIDESKRQVSASGVSVHPW